MLWQIQQKWGHIEEMGLGKRMMGVFFSPGATFESVRSRAGTSDWLVPLIILAIVVAITAYLVTPMAMEQETGQDGTGRNQYGGYADH